MTLPNALTQKPCDRVYPQLVVVPCRQAANPAVTTDGPIREPGIYVQWVKVVGNVNEGEGR